MTTPQPSLASHPQELMTEEAIDQLEFLLDDMFPGRKMKSEWRVIFTQAKSALSLTAQLAQEKRDVEHYKQMAHVNSESANQSHAKCVEAHRQLAEARKDAEKGKRVVGAIAIACHRLGIDFMSIQTEMHNVMREAEANAAALPPAAAVEGGEGNG